MDTFIYAVVFPFCGVMALRRVLFNDLRWDVAVWSVPSLVGSYALFEQRMSGTQLLAALALAQLVFVGAVVAGARLSDWLEERSGS